MKIRKNIIKTAALFFVLAVTAAAFLPMAAGAYSGCIAEGDIPVDIRVNDNYLASGGYPYLDGGVVMAPVRTVAEALLADTVYWDGERGATVVEYGGRELVLYEDSAAAAADGSEINLPHAAVTHDGKMFAPVGVLADFLESYIFWDDDFATVKLYKDGADLYGGEINWTYTEDELLWLARIVQCESGGQPVDGKVGVANVIINRTKSAIFPNTIYEVIFDKKYGVQFTPSVSGAIYNSPSADCIYSAKMALRGKNTVGNSLYFFNPKNPAVWVKNNRTYYTTIADHAFYL